MAFKVKIRLAQPIGSFTCPVQNRTIINTQERTFKCTSDVMKAIRMGRVIELARIEMKTTKPADAESKEKVDG